jgi:DNA-directed RNA polymerase, sigma subunit (sigma70/sigma32)
MNLEVSKVHQLSKFEERTISLDAPVGDDDESSLEEFVPSEKVPLPTQEAERGTELEFVIMVIAVSCVKLLSAHNSTQHTSRKHKV